MSKKYCGRAWPSLNEGPLLKATTWGKLAFGTGPSGDSPGVKAQPSIRVSINFRQHKSPKSWPGWPNTHQCTSSVLSIVGVQMDESQLQVAQCHLGCSLYFSPFSLLAPIPVTYLPIHLPTPSFTQPFLLPPPPSAKPSLPLRMVHAFCRQKAMRGFKLLSWSHVQVLISVILLKSLPLQLPQCAYAWEYIQFAKCRPWEAN
jgi:hypothetical protein